MLLHVICLENNFDSSQFSQNIFSVKNVCYKITKDNENSYCKIVLSDFKMIIEIHKLNVINVNVKLSQIISANKGFNTIQNEKPEIISI